MTAPNVTIDEQILAFKMIMRGDPVDEAILATLQSIKDAGDDVVEPEEVKMMRYDEPEGRSDYERAITDYIDTLLAKYNMACVGLDIAIKTSEFNRQRAEKAESERDEFRKDAERYRWIRNHDDSFYIRHTPKNGFECDLFGHDLDAAIDSARNK